MLKFYMQPVPLRRISMPLATWLRLFATPLARTCDPTGSRRRSRPPLRGALYLTARRLIHLGQVVLTVKLVDVLETSLAGERLLISLRDGEGLCLDVDQPRLLRAELAAVLRGLRA